VACKSDTEMLENDIEMLEKIKRIIREVNIID
jgi:hypothetical protein